MGAEVRNGKIDDLDRLDREVVALGNDYVQGFVLPQHQHRRAQLLYGATGLMHVSTRDGEWVVPPQHAVWIPPKPCMLSGLQASRHVACISNPHARPDCVT